MFMWLDVPYNRNVTANELNEVGFNTEGLYFQSQEKFLKDKAIDINICNLPFSTGCKTIGDFLVAEAILIRDLGHDEECGLVNVSKMKQ